MNKDSANSNIHIGKIIALKGNEALVAFQRSSMCNHCKACGIRDEQTMETYVLNEMSAKEGDSVIVELNSKTILKASLIAYIIPLCAFLTGLVLGIQFGNITAIVMPILFCLLSLFLLHYLDKKLKRKPIYRPHITKILDSGNE